MLLLSKESQDEWYPFSLASNGQPAKRGKKTLAEKIARLESFCLSTMPEMARLPVSFTPSPSLSLPSAVLPGLE